MNFNENLFFFLHIVVGNYERNVFSYRFRRSIAKHFFPCFIPGFNRSIKGFADNRIVTIFNNRSEVPDMFFIFFCVR